MKTLMPPDFIFQFTNLLFLLPPILKAIYDVYFHQNKGIAVNHKKSLAYSILFGFLMVLIDFRSTPVPYLWQSILLSIGYFWLFFDYIRNILAKVHVFYVDSNPSSDAAEDSWMDVNFYSKMPWYGVLFLKGWFLLVGVSCYYYLSYITGDSWPIVVWK
jgi:hypothetical protein